MNLSRDLTEKFKDKERSMGVQADSERYGYRHLIQNSWLIEHYSRFHCDGTWYKLLADPASSDGLCRASRDRQHIPPFHQIPQ
jgi:hypothetical protein